MSAKRCDELRLTGSGGANRVMEAEIKRLVMRSPFVVRIEKPRREGDATLLYPFDARVAWVAALPSPHVVANRLGSLLERGDTPRAALRRSPARALVGRQAP